MIKVFIVHGREKISREICRSPEQRDKETDWIWLGVSVKEGKAARDKKERARERILRRAGTGKKTLLL